jgi:hypothetical protein
VRSCCLGMSLIMSNQRPFSLSINLGKQETGRARPTVNCCRDILVFLRHIICGHNFRTHFLLYISLVTIARIDSLFIFSFITTIPNVSRRSLANKLHPLSTISGLEFLLALPPPLHSSAPFLPSSDRSNHQYICSRGRTLFHKLFITFDMF